MFEIFGGYDDTTVELIKVKIESNYSTIKDCSGDCSFMLHYDNV